MASRRALHGSVVSAAALGALVSGAVVYVFTVWFQLAGSVATDADHRSSALAVGISGLLSLGVAISARRSNAPRWSRIVAEAVTVGALIWVVVLLVQAPGAPDGKTGYPPGEVVEVMAFCPSTWVSVGYLVVVLVQHFRDPAPRTS